MKLKKILVMFINIILLISIVRMAISDDDDHWDFSYDFRDAKIYTSVDVASHSSGSDCLIIVKEKVYDITRFRQREEKARNLICGKDNSDLYVKLFGRDTEKIDRYYVGELNQGNKYNVAEKDEDEKVQETLPEPEVQEIIHEDKIDDVQNTEKPTSEIQQVQVKTEQVEKSNNEKQDVSVTEKTVSCPEVKVLEETINYLNNELETKREKLTLCEEKDLKIEYLEKKIESMENIIIELNRSFLDSINDNDDEGIVTLSSSVVGVDEIEQQDKEDMQNQSNEIPQIDRRDDEKGRLMFSKILNWIGLI